MTTRSVIRIGKNKTQKAITKRQVEQMIASHMELKLQVGHSSAAASTSGTITYMSGIAQGDDISGRTGDRIRPTYMEFRFQVIDATSNTTRLIFFQDRMASGSIGAVTDVLSSANVNSTYNSLFRTNQRFKILRDVQVFTSAAGEQARLVKGRIKLSGFIGYFGTGATSASAGVNSIGVLIITEAGTPTYDLFTEFGYTDA